MVNIKIVDLEYKLFKSYKDLEVWKINSKFFILAVIQISILVNEKWKNN